MTIILPTTDLLERLHGALIVSCQASPGNPLEDADAIRRIAESVVQAGAAGLRINSPEHIRAIRKSIDLPVIGLQKKYVEERLQITPDFESACRLAEAGATIIAVDCTGQENPAWRELVQRIRSELKVPVMADIASVEEAREAEAAGVDFIGTTLYGYTAGTSGNHQFNWRLLTELKEVLSTPIIAEGHIFEPDQAQRAIRLGAHAVVVGSAITRPGDITRRFLTSVRLAATSAQAIGVDIGGTAVKAALVDSNGEILSPISVPTNAAKGREAIAESLLESVRQVLASAQKLSIYPIGIGIASAGAIDGKSGKVFAATDNLPGWSGFDLCGFVRQNFNLPAFAANDAHAAALSALRFGAGKEFNNFIAITIGTGVGGGVVIDGVLLKGQLGFAGTVGHQTIHTNGMPCNCGRRGCLEAYVSTAALNREYKTLLNVNEAALQLEGAELAFEINRRAREADPKARAAYSILAEHLAEGIANLFNLFDPEVILLSGGLIEGYPQFPSEVELHVARLLHFGNLRKPRILPAVAGRFAGVQGAAALIFDALSKGLLA